MGVCIFISQVFMLVGKQLSFMLALHLKQLISIWLVNARVCKFKVYMDKTSHPIDLMGSN